MTREASAEEIDWTKGSLFPVGPCSALITGLSTGLSLTVPSSRRVREGMKALKVGVAGNSRPVSGEDLTTLLVGLALPDDAHACALEPEIESTDSRADRPDIHIGPEVDAASSNNEGCLRCARFSSRPLVALWAWDAHMMNRGGSIPRRSARVLMSRRCLAVAKRL